MAIIHHKKGFMFIGFRFENIDIYYKNKRIWYLSI